MVWYLTGTARQELVIASHPVKTSGSIIIWFAHQLNCHSGAESACTLAGKQHQIRCIWYFLFIVSHMNRSEDGGVTGHLSLGVAASRVFVTSWSSFTVCLGIMNASNLLCWLSAVIFVLVSFACLPRRHPSVVLCLMRQILTCIWLPNLR